MGKLFYKRKKRIPEWMQVYVLWAFGCLISIPIVYYFGLDVQKQKNININQLPRVSATELNSYYSQLNIQKPDNLRKLLNKINFDLVKANLQIDKWNIKDVKYNVGDIQCQHIYLLKAGDLKSKIAFAVPIDENKTAEVLLASLSATKLLESNSSQITLLFFDARYQCYSASEAKQSINDNIPDTKIVLLQKISTLQVQNSILRINGKFGRTSSINWLTILPDHFETPGILNQLAYTFSPAYQGFSGSLFDNDIPTISITYPDNQNKNQFILASEITNDILEIAYKNNTFANEYIDNQKFWISDNLALNRLGLNWIIALFIIMMWFPFLNQKYNDRERLELMKSSIGTVYYSLVPILACIALHISYDMQISSPFVIPTIVAGCVVFAIVLRRVERSNFDLFSNQTTSLYSLCVVMTIMALFNNNLFLHSLLLFFAVTTSLHLPRVIRIVLIAISFVPTILLMHYFYEDNWTNLLGQQIFYIETFFSHSFSSVPVILLIGLIINTLKQK